MKESQNTLLLPEIANFNTKYFILSKINTDRGVG